MPYTPVTLTGQVRDSAGNLSTVNGQIYFTLSQNGNCTSGAFSIAAGIPIVGTVTAGIIQASYQVTGNDDITPTGTFYVYEVIGADGSVIVRQNLSVLISNGASQAINTLTFAQLPFSAGAGTPNTRLFNTTSPLGGGGDLSADRTLSITTSPPGGTAVATSRNINTSAPITGGGDLSADRTIGITTATDSTSGAISASDHAFIDTTVIWANKVATGGSGTSGAPYTGWDAAINWTLGNQTINFPALTGGAAAFYQTAVAGFTISGSNTRLRGIGSKTATIVFPTQSVDGNVMITVDSGIAATINHCEISGLSFNSPDTTHTKTALRVRDASTFLARDLVVVDGAWTGNSSIGIDTRGREFMWFDDCTIFADLPFKINKNDGSAGSAISFDHSRIQRTNLAAKSGSSNYCITVQDGVYLTNATFRELSLQRGAGGFQMLDTTAISSNLDVVFDQLRVEQATGGTTYMIDMESTAVQIQNLVIRNLYGGSGTHGIKLRSVVIGEVENFFYVDNGKTAVDIDSTDTITFIGGFRQVGSTVSLATSKYVSINSLIPATGIPATHIASTVQVPANDGHIMHSWGMLATAAVNLNSATDQAVFTMPSAGFTGCVITDVVTRNFSALATTASWGFGASGTPTDWVASATYAGAVTTKAVVLSGRGGAGTTKYGTSTAFVCHVTAPQGSACTANVDVYGYYW